MRDLRRILNRVFIFGFLFLLIGVGSACQMRQKGRKPAADWSRGLPVGVFVRGDVELVVQADGSLVHFLWLTEDEKALPQVRYVVLDQTAVSQTDLPLAISATQIRYPRLLLSNNDFAHLLWSTREEGAPGWDLWYGQIDERGDFQGDSRQLALPEDEIVRYDVAADGAGGLFVVWQNGAEEMIFGAHIDADGTLMQPAQPLAAGSSPSIQVDEAGTLHMASLLGSDVVYAQWPDGNLTTAVSTIITTFPESRLGRMDGPEVAVAGEWGYIFWSNYYSSGLEAGTAVSEYVAFPLENPQKTAPKQIRVTPDENQAYEPYQSAYHLTQLAPPAAVDRSTNFIREPKPTSGREGELAVALTMSQNSRLNEFIQVATALFKDGEYMGYQLAGKTEAFSQNPILATDDNGDLYIAWRDGGRGTLAYYAVTTPAGQAALNRMESEDIATVALNGGIELIAGMLFFPLSIIWIIPGFLIIGVYNIWKGESTLKEPVTIILLVISIGVSQMIKFLFLPTLLTYVPFSAWLDFSSAWDSVLIVTVPILTAVSGFLVAFLMRKRTESAIAFYFWFTATDALLTLAIYGVNFLGVF